MQADEQTVIVNLLILGVFHPVIDHSCRDNVSNEMVVHTHATGVIMLFAGRATVGDGASTFNKYV